MIIKYHSKYSKSNDIVKKLHRFSLLIFGGFFGLMLVSLYLFKNDPVMRFQAIIALAINYTAWAIFHHYLDKTLTLEIVIEYVLIACFVLVILSSILIL